MSTWHIVSEYSYFQLCGFRLVISTRAPEFEALNLQRQCFCVYFFVFCLFCFVFQGISPISMSDQAVRSSFWFNIQELVLKCLPCHIVIPYFLFLSIYSLIGYQILCFGLSLLHTLLLLTLLNDFHSFIPLFLVEYPGYLIS